MGIGHIAWVVYCSCRSYCFCEKLKTDPPEIGKKKLKKDENIQEYYLTMRELASQRGVDVESTIHHRWYPGW